MPPREGVSAGKNFATEEHEPEKKLAESGEGVEARDDQDLDLPNDSKVIDEPGSPNIYSTNLASVQSKPRIVPL